jgi:hypothetical protein
MNRIIRMLHLVLREIFEEAAYERFCTSHGIPPGRNSYLDFLREQSGSRKLHCC